MAEERAQRRLTTILAADVVGYSRLMEKDEAGTMALLRARRHDVLMPMVAQHGGRVFKVMGDGVLVEFSSVVNAVECAIDLQKAMQAQNAGIPAEQHILLRIGINLGDVIVEGGDLYGDGVNIAARLESLAEPGGICVSGDVYRQVRSKLQTAVRGPGRAEGQEHRRTRARLPGTGRRRWIRRDRVSGNCRNPHRHCRGSHRSPSCPSPT